MAESGSPTAQTPSARPPALPAPPAPVPPVRKQRRGRPVFGILVAATVAVRLGRDVAQRVAVGRFGPVGVVIVFAGFVAVVLAWRGYQRQRARRAGGVEFTPELVARQLAEAGVGPPAFVEDGTLLGASVLVLNQHAKVLEITTDYEVFDSAARPLGSVRQIGQSRGKRVARIFTGFDQYFTHHFELLDRDGRPVLRLTRPRKLFLTKVHVFDGDDRFLGTIQQRNVWWKIRFGLVGADGREVGQLRAENLRAWDFHVYDAAGRCVATVIKSWEGWARTAVTRADRYVVRVHVPLPYPMRQLTVAAALATDLALKQDARGLL